MKRRTVVTDRLCCAVAGAALIAVGAFAAAWGHGDSPVPTGGTLTMPWLPGVVDAPWWPFALGAAGVVLIAVGLRWLFSHRPGQTLGSAPLPGSGGAGHLTVDLDTAASAAAEELSRRPHIAAASGTSLTDRGRRVIELDVKIDPSPADLKAALSTVDAVRRQLVAALDGVPVAVRVLLRTPPSRRGSRRVA